MPCNIYVVGANKRYSEVETNPEAVERAVENSGLNTSNIHEKGTEVIVSLVNASGRTVSADSMCIYTPTMPMFVERIDEKPYSEGLIDFFLDLKNYGEQKGADAVLVDNINVKKNFARFSISGLVCALRAVK